jgi:putative ABC transport system permease protein
VRRGFQVVYGDQNWSTQIQGVAPAYCDIRQWPVQDGAMFTDSDVRGTAKVCVLGTSVRDQLFLTDDPVGKTIRIKDIPFRVIGVLSSKGGQGMMGDQDDVVLIPWTTAQRRLLGITYLQNITISAVSQAQMTDAQDQVSELLRQRHHIRPGDPDDFMFFSQQDIASAAETTSQTMTMLLASIAAVSLLVGGIGIMNIMLVSVTERTREIGIRRALGARRQDVLLQFLVEAVFLSLAGAHDRRAARGRRRQRGLGVRALAHAGAAAGRDGRARVRVDGRRVLRLLSGEARGRARRHRVAPLRIVAASASGPRGSSRTGGRRR